MFLILPFFFKLKKRQKCYALCSALMYKDHVCATYVPRMCVLKKNKSKMWVSCTRIRDKDREKGIGSNRSK